MLPSDLYKCMCVRTIKRSSCLHQAVSRLSIVAEGAATKALGNLFQCFTTLMVKNFFLISNLNLPSFS